MKRYIERIRQKFMDFPDKTQEKKREELAKQRLILGLKYSVYALTAFALLRGVIVAMGGSVSVSNSVNGKELPIYCVETKEPQIALSFDAAWGNS